MHKQERWRGNNHLQKYVEVEFLGLSEWSILALKEIENPKWKPGCNQDGNTGGFWIYFPWHTWINSLREIQKPVVWLLHIGWLKKYPHWNGEERLRQTLVLNPIPNILPWSWKRTSNFQLFSGEWRVWATRIGAQLFRLPS